jgi:hypothetical protein
MAIKHRIDKQRTDREYLSEMGGAGTISSLAMGMIDPVNVAAMFIPVGAVARGGSIAETAGRFALANAAGGGVSEAALQATQEARSPMESVSNVVVDALRIRYGKRRRDILREITVYRCLIVFVVRVQREVILH